MKNCLPAWCTIAALLSTPSKKSEERRTIWDNIVEKCPTWPMMTTFSPTPETTFASRPGTPHPLSQQARLGEGRGKAVVRKKSVHLTYLLPSVCSVYTTLYDELICYHLHLCPIRWPIRTKRRFTNTLVAPTMRQRRCGAPFHHHDVRRAQTCSASFCHHDADQHEKEGAR